MHSFRKIQGRLVEIEIQSSALKGNLLGDPHTRTTAIYLPEAYDQTDRTYPLLLYLASYGGSGLKKISWQRFGESIPQRIERLIAEGSLQPMLVAFPDCFTSLGGNQYVNSPVLGRWEDFLLEELIPRLEETFRISRGPRHRAVVGYSSGGYGAFVQGLRHGNSWAAIASHSGDIGFENLFRGEFPKLLTQLAQTRGDLQLFLKSFRESVKVRGDQFCTLMMLAQAASYDPCLNEPLGIRLPVDLQTCQLLPERWANWLDHDPLEMILKRSCQENLAHVSSIYFDCGAYDQYHLQYGSRLFSKRLEQLGISHCYEEFEDNHSDIEYRLNRSLPFLSKAVSA